MLLKSHVPNMSTSKSVRTENLLRQLHTDAEQMPSEKEGKIWMVYLTKNFVSHIIKYQLQLRGVRKR